MDMEFINEVQKSWVPVNGYEGYYEINILGVVKSLKREIVIKAGKRSVKEKIITTRTNNCGYVEIRLHKNGKTKTTFIHLLLASAFIDNPKKKIEVNHINGNKLDNRLENLEWVDHSENVIHAYKNGLFSCKSNSKKVIDSCQEITFPSVRKAAEFYSISYSTCKNYLNGNRKNPTCLQYYNNVHAA